MPLDRFERRLVVGAQVVCLWGTLLGACLMVGARVEVPSELWMLATGALCSLGRTWAHRNLRNGHGRRRRGRAPPAARAPQEQPTQPTGDQ
jgi:hypothetical protein